MTAGFSQRLDEREHFFVRSYASRFRIREFSMNGIEVVLFEGQQVFDGMSDKLLATFAGMRGENIESEDLRPF